MQTIKYLCLYVILILRQEHTKARSSIRINSISEEEQNMKELEFKYGCNPNQKPSRIYMNDGRNFRSLFLSGRPGYINFLDAFNGWQLV